METRTLYLLADDAKVRVKFYKDDMFRNWLAQDGDFYRVDTNDVTLRIYKKPLRFALYGSENKALVLKETKGLSWKGEETKQTLTRGETEQIFGGGMQNGRFTHRD